MFYYYRQNNSGGSYHIDEKHGIHLVIEAKDHEYADFIAEKEAGIYFNGCRSGRDCNCCGDRWTPQWSADCGSKYPALYRYWDGEEEEEQTFLEAVENYISDPHYFPSRDEEVFDLYKLDGTRERAVVSRDGKITHTVFNM